MAEVLRIPRTAVTISVRTLASGGVRITYPRAARAVLGALAFLAGLGVWVCLLPPDPWAEPLEYALGLLLLAPGAWLIVRAMGQRPVIELSGGELTVMYGPAFFERAVARLPLDALEVRVATDVTQKGVRYDAHAVSTRLLAALSPIPGPKKLPETGLKLYRLQVRNKGQEMWLALLGSQLASEIENARLVIVAAAAMAADESQSAEVRTANGRE